MALINCPECGKSISDKSEICVGCGFPIKEYLADKEAERIKNEKVPCPYCGEPTYKDDDYCDECGMRLIEYERATISKVEEKVFTGVYRYDFLKGKLEVYCPRCRSENCSHYKENVIVPGKSKTSYTANLNPLKPFTILNKKEKVVRQEQVITKNRFMCNDCGAIFR